MLSSRCCYKRISSTAGIIIGVIVFVCLLFGVFYLMFNTSTFTGGNRRFGGQLTQQQEEIKKLFNLCSAPPQGEQPKRPPQGEQPKRPPQGEQPRRPPQGEQPPRRQTKTTTSIYDDIDFL